MKILVTGGAGFIGSAFILRLFRSHAREADFDVFSIDNNWRYAYDSLERALAKIEPKGKLQLIKGDISNEKFINHFLEDNKPDIVVHLAAIPGERLCTSYSIETFQSNIYGSYLLLSKLKDMEVKLIIFASSQVVYGHPKRLPISEKHHKQSTDLYSFTKIAGEHLTDMFYQKYGLPMVTLRFSSVYGFGAFTRWYEVTAKFARFAAEGKDLPVFRPPNLSDFGIQTADLIHVNDVSDAIIQIIKLISSGSIEELMGDAFNVGSGIGTSIERLAEIVAEIGEEKIGKTVGIREVESYEYEIPKIILDIKKIKQKVGWRPKISLEEGLCDLMDKYMAGYAEVEENVEIPQRTIGPTS